MKVDSGLDTQHNYELGNRNAVAFLLCLWYYNSVEREWFHQQVNSISIEVLLNYWS